MNLPLFIDPEAWQEYEIMRRRIKKPLTDLGAKRLLNRCNELAAKGWDVNEALLVAADCHWLTVYPPKDMTIQSNPARRSDDTAKWMAEQEQARKSACRPPQALLRMVGKA
jgi:hypothetical protein